MNLEQAKQKIAEAIDAAERRKEVEHFTDERNIKELLFAIEYALNPPTKTGRKV
jgi:non-homologous end joining protein Ku